MHTASLHCNTIRIETRSQLQKKSSKSYLKRMQYSLTTKSVNVTISMVMWALRKHSEALKPTLKRYSAMQALEDFATYLIRYLAAVAAFSATTSSASALGVAAAAAAGVGAETLSMIWNSQLKMCSRAKKKKSRYRVLTDAKSVVAVELLRGPNHASAQYVTGRVRQMTGLVPTAGEVAEHNKLKKSS